MIPFSELQILDRRYNKLVNKFDRIPISKH